MAGGSRLFDQFFAEIGRRSKIDLAKRAAKQWMPAEVACIDIASSGAHFGIVEANCFSASRFYAADPATVLAAVARHSRAGSISPRL